MRIEVIRGGEAASLIDDPGFHTQWQSLHGSCPWATSMQGVPFVTTWYRTYISLFEPVIITGRRSCGLDLSGLLTLAVQHDTKKLVVAGTHHAEYQVWLSTREDSAEYMDSMFDALWNCLPGQPLEFRYLPSGAPVDCILRSAKWKKLSALQPLSNGLFRTDSSAENSLRKKSNKSRLHRLERIGEVRFEQVSSVSDAQQYLDRIIPFSDFRQGALNGVLPFRDDPLKREFYLNLMKETAIVHTTILRAGEEIVSGHVGIYDRDRVLLSVLAHSPFLARHSPGKLHVLLLTNHLRSAGIAALDLTLGDEYKRRFANDYETVHTLTLFLSHARAHQHKIAVQLKGVVKRTMAHLGVSPNLLRRRLRGQRSIPSIRRLVERIIGQGIQIYRLHGQTETHLIGFVRSNCLDDLMAFQGRHGSRRSLQRFLDNVSRKLAAGEEVFTHVEDDLLTHYVWLYRHSAGAAPYPYTYCWCPPLQSAVLHDFYSHPSMTNPSRLQTFVVQTLSEIRTNRGIAEIYWYGFAGSRGLRAVVEGAGFRLLSQFHQE